MNRLLRTLVVGSTLVFASSGAKAQYYNFVKPKFLVTAPSSFSGPKQFTWNSGTDWGTKPVVNYVNVPVSRISPDSLACSSISTNLTGKFALIFRGDCEFGAKSLLAQQKGATGVIIVNNVVSDPIAMGGGAVGSQVTIPVIMVNKADGNAINSLLISGQTVTVTFSRWGLGLNNDLSIADGSPIMPHASAIPFVQLSSGNGNPRAYKGYTGAYIANLSNAGGPSAGNQSNVKLRSTLTWTPSGGASQLVRVDSIGVATFNRADSVITVFDTTGYQLTASGKGRFKWNYNVSMANADQYVDDNTDSTVEMYTTDSIISKAKWDPNAMRPVSSGGTRLASNGPFTTGFLYYNAKGGYAMRKLQFSVGSDSPNIMRYSTTVTGMIWKWVDGANGNDRDNLIQGGELVPIAGGAKAISATDSTYVNNYMNLVRAGGGNLTPKTEDNSWYWVALGITDGNIRIGLDNKYSYYTRADITSNPDSTRTEFWAPYTPNDPANVNSNVSDLWMFPFYATNDINRVSYSGTLGLNPSLALHTSKDVVTAVDQISNPVVDLKLFPNPASSTVNVSYKFAVMPKDILVSVLNSVGQIVSAKHFAPTMAGELSLPVHDLVPGQYYLTIAGADGIRSQPFTVVSH